MRTADLKKNELGNSQEAAILEKRKIQKGKGSIIEGGRNGFRGAWGKISMETRGSFSKKNGVQKRIGSAASVPLKPG